MTSRYFCLAILFILHFPSFTFGQNDSLYTTWQNDQLSDSLRIQAAYKYIFDNYVFSNPDSAVILAEQLLALTRKKKYLQGEATALRLQGTIELYQSNYVEALDYYEQSLAISTELGDSSGISSALGNIGIVYGNRGDFTRALQYAFQDLEIIESLGLRDKLPKALGNIGVLYADLGEHDKALAYYQRTLAIAEELNQPSVVARSLANMGNEYGKQDMYELALDHYRRSMAVEQEIGNKIGIATTNVNIGIIHKRQRDYETALNHLWRSLETIEQYGNKRLSMYVHLNIGSCHFEMGDYRQAVGHCETALAQSKTLEILDVELDACECLYRSFRKMNQHERAIEYLEKKQVVADSIAAHKAEEQLQAMEFRRAIVQDSLEREAEKRRIEAMHRQEVLEKTKARNTMMGIGLIALLLAGGFYSRWRYTSRAKQAIEKERERSENLLLNILPAEIAEELKEKGRADARQFEEVTILFTDFKDFTELSQSMSAQDLVSEINTCFEAFDEICVRHKIEKIKTIGDSYMAAGGLPVPDPESTSRVVLAALDMMDFMIERQRICAQEGKTTFAMRAGIHSGSVVAGIVGVQKFQYDIWGDTVNTASRIESSGIPGKVNISSATYTAIANDSRFRFVPRGSIDVKGKGSVEMYFVDKA